jgi:hypothetical protein
MWKVVRPERASPLIFEKQTRPARTSGLGLAAASPAGSRVADDTLMTRLHSQGSVASFLRHWIQRKRTLQP